MEASQQRIRKLSRQAFEEMIAEIYSGEGYLVEKAAPGSADAGYDLILLRETSVLVQCKHWLDDQVGVAPVRQLAAAMQKVGAGGGVCVTRGAFTKAARALAAGAGIELIDGEALPRTFSTRQKNPGKKHQAA